MVGLQLGLAWSKVVFIYKDVYMIQQNDRQNDRQNDLDANVLLLGGSRDIT